jgi:hypothetical protein
MEVMNVRWNGGPEDPTEIRQFGHTFPKGEWVKVQHDPENPAHVTRVNKLKGNPTFDVKGEKRDPESKLLSNEQPDADPNPVRPPVTTYRVTGSKKDGFVVADDKGNVIGTDVYKTADDAQAVADALNAPKPA